MGFMEVIQAIGSPRILELGTKRSNPEVSTLQKEHYPFAGEYVGTDIQPGLDVDVVADVHSLSQTFGEESFDVILSFSTFEHIKYPVLAAHEIMKTLRVGGHVFIQTHFVYHEHAYPYDYYRYTREGLSALFPPTMNFKTHGASFHYPAEIHSERVPWIPGNQAFLNVHYWGEKTGHTPTHFIYDLDALVPSPDPEVVSFRERIKSLNERELLELREQYRQLERREENAAFIILITEELIERNGDSTRV